MRAGKRGNEESAHHPEEGRDMDFLARWISLGGRYQVDPIITGSIIRCTHP